MTYKVILFPHGVTTEEATDMKTLASELDSNPFMIVATQHVSDPEEPYQAIRYPKKGLVQVNYLSGPEFVEADSIAEALSGDAPVVEPVYVLLSSEPNDWESNYANYFTKEGENDYKAVVGVEVTTYSPEFALDTYYKKEMVEEEEVYVLLDAEPEDWGTGEYYTSDAEEEPTYTLVEFTSSTETIAPEFAQDTYYKLESL